MSKILQVYDFVKGLPTESKLVLATGVLTVLLVILVVLVGVFISHKLMDIKHAYFAKAMEKAEDVLYTISQKSFLLLRTDVVNNPPVFKTGACNVCQYPVRSVDGELRNAKKLIEEVLVHRNILRVRTRFKKNHFDKLSEKRLVEEKIIFSKRLFKKSMYDFETLGLYELPILKNLKRKNKFSEKEAIKFGSEIIDMYITTHKEMRKEMKSLILFPLTFWKWVKSND